MDTTTNAVETKVQAAATDQKSEVKTQDGNASAQPVDFQAEITAKNAEITRLQEERDNYKKGMLKAKGKANDSFAADDDDLSIDEKISRAVQEKLLDTQLMKAQKEKDELLEKALKENRELRTAMQNRSQISNASVGGSNETKMDVKDNFFSEAQIAALKKQGYDDKKIELLKKNILKGRP